MLSTLKEICQSFATSIAEKCDHVLESLIGLLNDEV
jgi:hypothetical protein